jgi:hypothetical protein
MACLLCDDTGWVCEVHPDQPWDGPHGCAFGGAGRRASLQCRYGRRAAAPPEGVQARWRVRDG